jgi:pullulanase/glycogen debranching enzyme
MSMYEILLTDGVKYPVRASRVDGFRTMSHFV